VVKKIIWRVKIAEPNQKKWKLINIAAVAINQPFIRNGNKLSVRRPIDG